MYQPKTTRVRAERGIETTKADLDARSIVALEWTQLWARRHLRINPLGPVVVRRALCLLADHLSNLDADRLAAERRAFSDASAGSGSARSLTEARARIEHHQEAPGAQPMDHWRDALQSKEERAESKRMLEALEQRVAAWQAEDAIHA
jgi:hypothetical protein